MDEKIVGSFRCAGFPRGDGSCEADDAHARPAAARLRGDNVQKHRQGQSAVREVALPCQVGSAHQRRLADYDAWYPRKVSEGLLIHSSRTLQQNVLKSIFGPASN